MRVLGIDFGTSNTVAMVRSADGRARPLLFDGTPLLPSAVYLDPAGRLLVGRDAERAARLDPGRFEPNPKRRVDDGTLLLGDRELPLPEVIAAVLGRIAVEARRQIGDCDELRLTHPARWGERRRSVLVAAALAAGLPRPRLIAEPVAAAAYYPAVLGAVLPAGRSLAVYDLGAGTFDAAVVRRTATGFEVLAEQGLADLGGLDFDHALVEHLGRGHAGHRTEQWRALVRPLDAHQRRQRALLYDDVRGAKELLSRAARADVHLPVLEISAHVTREELESLIRPRLAQTVHCLARTIAAARLAPADLVGIFLVGGSSRIPLAARLIHTELGFAPTTLEQPETVVAEGVLCVGAPLAGASPGPAAGAPPHLGAAVVGPGQGVAFAPRALGTGPPAPGSLAPGGLAPGGLAPGRSAPGSPVPGPPASRRSVPGSAPGPARRVPPANRQPHSWPPGSVAVPASSSSARPPAVSGQSGRLWHGETGMLWTAVLSVLVLIALAVLITVVVAG